MVKDSCALIVGRKDILITPMSMYDFAHLHLHTEFSLLDGANRVDDVPVIATELGMKSIAITDHGTLSGLLEFYQACKKNNIKPIVGIEAYLTNDPDGLPKEQRTRDNYHMILLASTFEGYQNLVFLSSNAYQNNFYYKPRISIETLKKYSKGLIANSACLASICARNAEYDAINNAYWDPHKTVQKKISEFQEIFNGNFNLELMNNPFPQQEAYNKFLISQAKETGVPLVITADTHYSRKDDYELHSLLMAMQTKQTLQEYHSKSEFHYGPWYYIKSPQEMYDLAVGLGVPEAFDRAGEIASMCNLELPLGKYKLPSYDITKDRDYDEYVRTRSVS
jgi:DNA polymerase-3 subunit alpha